MATAFTKRMAFAGALKDVKIYPLRDAEVQKPARRPGALTDN